MGKASKTGRKRLDVRGAVAGCVRVGDVADDRRLARREPLRLLRSDFEEGDGRRWNAFPWRELDQSCASRPARGLPGEGTRGQKSIRLASFDRGCVKTPSRVQSP